MGYGKIQQLQQNVVIVEFLKIKVQENPSFSSFFKSDLRQIYAKNFVIKSI
jgi:hypothetical protein